MTNKYFIDKNIPGLLRKTEDPLSGILIGIDASWVCDALNNYESQKSEIGRLRRALEQLAKLGNGDTYGNSEGNCIAQQALKEKSNG